jgi:hypothetical protein
VLIDDFNSDGNPDLLLAGNYYPVNIQRGRYDASYGLVLTGNSKGNLEVLPAIESGLSVSGEVRKMRKIRIKGKVYYLAIRNNDKVEVLTLK